MQITIAFPDEGAWKRFHMQLSEFPEVICTKVRDGDKRIVRLKVGCNWHLLPYNAESIQEDQITWPTVAVCRRANLETAM